MCVQEFNKDYGYEYLYWNQICRPVPHYVLRVYKCMGKLLHQGVQAAVMQVNLSLVLHEASQSSLGYILLEYAVLQTTTSIKNK